MDAELKAAVDAVEMPKTDAERKQLEMTLALLKLLAKYTRATATE